MRIKLFLLAACSLSAAAAFGYVLENTRWPQGSNVTMQLSLGTNQTLIDGYTSFNQSAEDALARWNAVMSRLQFSVVRNSSVQPQPGDQQNSAFFSSTVFGESFGSGTLAVTVRRSPQGSTTTTETDVVFNSARKWNSYRGPLRQAQSGGSLDDLHRVAIHEFGHVLGLDHPDAANQHVTAIMNAYVSGIDGLQQDDINGAQYLYGGPAPTATPTPPPAAADNLINISTRGFVGTNQNVLIGGFIVQGAQGTSVVLRALGPSLGITGSLSDPVLELRDQSGTLVKRNDDWEQDASTAATLQAKGLQPSAARESATIAQVGNGNYTVTVSGYRGETGIGLFELYDLQGTNGRVANISTRGSVRLGDAVMIAGFIIGGDQPKQVAIRGIGPSLTNAGIAGALADPLLELRDSAGSLITQNDDWRAGSNAATLQSKGLAPANDRESAVLVTLNPGSYTAVVRGLNGGTGVALVEAYDLSPAPNQ